jgi:inhibitor of the pro-sigma K processing machinery
MIKKEDVPMHLLPQEGILFVAFAIIVILLIAKLATSPIQAMVKLLVNSMAAVMLLCFISIVGEYWGIHLPINPVTILLIAILGLPGLLLVAMLYFIFI